jgi:2-amino-4-hydroxy-6-hydroxymethyldihydropteridine diphosphokinase
LTELGPTGAEAREWVYIGLGSNIQDPRHQLESALRELARLPATRLAAVSPRYRTAPVGPADQPDFINAVACLETALAPSALLAALQQIEQRHGRRRGAQRWGPRSLDLDILLYGARELALADLRIPHPQMHRRAFVLVPLADIASAELEIPGLGRLGALLEQVTDDARVVRSGSLPPITESTTTP